MVNRINPEYTKRHQQIIIGTILGGSSIIKPNKGKHCYLSMRDRNSKWLEHKAFQLKNFASFEPFTIEKTNRWHSCCYPIFDDYREKFYNKKGNRKLDLDMLSGLWDVGMAIWFGDCGKIENGQLTLNTSVWGNKHSKTIIKYFGIIDWASDFYEERGGSRVVLDKWSTSKALQVVGHELPPFLKLTNDKDEV